MNDWKLTKHGTGIDADGIRITAKGYLGGACMESQRRHQEQVKATMSEIVGLRAENERLKADNARLRAQVVEMLRPETKWTRIAELEKDE